MKVMPLSIAAAPVAVAPGGSCVAQWKTAA